MQTQTQSIACASYVLYGGSNGCILQKMWKAINQREMGRLTKNDLKYATLRIKKRKRQLVS
ncbi:hypothetical protein CCAND93_90030 [Capnocytophaga canis]|uniref:Uncharacterized protein n=1 Tax=Capnocytophaga canis TaxID=1848903 RepID=A0A0B7IRC2_9FLAO|nr:hypothetical protein CAPN008_05700 [Capnocytophaga canis]CEN54446.1 hypothetical protein CCAND93_90030 [Capnocytophaga canis]